MSHISQKKIRDDVAVSVKDSDRAEDIIMITLEGTREPLERYSLPPELTLYL